MVSWLKREKYIVLPLIVIFAVFTGLITLSTLQDYATQPWIMSTDVIQFGNIIHKNIEPDLFPTDFIFSSRRYIDFYTPSFINLMTVLTRITNDYMLSLATMQFPLLVFYFPIMYLLLWWFTRSHPISILFTLLSVSGVSSFISEWEATGLEFMLARTYALPALTGSYLVYIFLYHREDEPRRPYKYWALLGAAIGITTNFHPTTGMTLAILMGSIILLQTLKNGKPGFIRLILVAIFTVIFALPTVIHIVGNSEIATIDESEKVAENANFREFARIFEDRIHTYPFQKDFGRGWTAESENIQFLIRFPWLPLTLLSYLIMRVNQRSLGGIVFMAMQLVFIYLMVDNMETMLLLLLIGYSIYKWWTKSDKTLLMLYELCAGIFLVAIAISLFIRPLWLEFELWSFTTFVLEVNRVSKQINIPIMLMFAAMAMDLWQNWQTLPSDRVLTRVLYVASLASTISMTFAPIGLVLVLIYDVISSRIKNMRIRYAIVIIYVSIIAGVIFSMYTLRQLVGQGRLEANEHPTVVGIFLFSSLIWLLVRNRFKEQARVQVIIMMIVCIIGGGLILQGMVDKGFERKSYDMWDVAEWARENTPPDTVFAVYTYGHDKGLFRLWSRRNDIYSEKDLNIIGYAQPYELIEAYDRFLWLDGWRFDLPEHLNDFFESQKVDYIIVDSSRSSPEVRNLDAAFRTSKYVVLKCPDEICEA